MKDHLLNYAVCLIKEMEKEIWQDIEATLQQLVENASLLREALSLQPELYSFEAMQKVQESLLARLVYHHELVQQDKKKRHTEGAPLARRIQTSSKVSRRRLSKNAPVHE